VDNREARVVKQNVVTKISCVSHRTELPVKKRALGREKGETHQGEREIKQTEEKKDKRSMGADAQRSCVSSKGMQGDADVSEGRPWGAERGDKGLCKSNRDNRMRTKTGKKAVSREHEQNDRVGQASVGASSNPLARKGRFAKKKFRLKMNSNGDQGKGRTEQSRRR